MNWIWMSVLREACGIDTAENADDNNEDWCKLWQQQQPRHCATSSVEALTTLFKACAVNLLILVGLPYKLSSSV